MKYKLDNIEYNVIIEKKNNKNVYIRVKDDLNIYVTCNYFCTKNYICNLLDSNIEALRKMIESRKCKVQKENMFFYLGKKYDIINVPVIDSIDIDNDNNIIYYKNMKVLDKWYNSEIFKIFTDRFKICFNTFDECDKMPCLKIRNMKTRWGVYNKASHTVTLNSHLIEYDLSKLDYVIYHELSHIIHFDHSKEFWNLVCKYCPDYKIIRKKLKD